MRHGATGTHKLSRPGPRTVPSSSLSGHASAAVWPTCSPPRRHLTDDDLGVVDEGIRRDLEVEWRRALADAARRVVVRAVAWAEPAVEVASTVDRHAAEI